MTESQKRRSISIRTFLLIAIATGILLGLFWPRAGKDFPDCAGELGNKVWIGVPTDEAILDRFASTYPTINVITSPMIVKEKIFEETMPCNFFNFDGHQEIHWVRIRADVYYTSDTTTRLPVYFEYDHYHMNGGGCSWKNAR